MAEIKTAKYIICDMLTLDSGKPNELGRVDNPAKAHEVRKGLIERATAYLIKMWSVYIEEPDAHTKEWIANVCKKRFVVFELSVKEGGRKWEITES